MSKDKDLSGILVCVLYFILGVVLIAATDELIKTFNYILVSICAIIGVIQLIGFFVGKKYKENNYSDLLVAVVFIWVSLILYVYYGFMIIILPILFSLYMFVMGLDMLTKFLNDKDKKNLILSLIAIVIGVLLIFNPGTMILTYLKVAGVYLVLVSILSFVSYFRRREDKSD